MQEKGGRMIKTYTKKAKLEIVRKICANYETGQYTLESCCKNAGVPYRTFRDWWIRYENERENEGGKWHFFAEVAALWEDAQRQHRTEVSNELVCKAETALHKSITGWEYEETITVGRRSIDKNGEITFIPIGIKKTKKYKAPSDSAIQFALKKLKPEIYGDI